MSAIPNPAEFPDASIAFGKIKANTGPKTTRLKSEMSLSLRLSQPLLSAVGVIVQAAALRHVYDSEIKKHWKIILIAVAVVVAVLLIPGAPAFLGSFFQHAGQVILSGAGAAAEGGGMSTWLKVALGGALAAGIVGLGFLTQKQASFEDRRLQAAKDELLRRLRANNGDNPCAKLFGGLKNAEKALKGTKFKVGPTVHPDAVAQTQGKTVTINPNNGFFDTSGFQTVTVGLLGTGGRMVPLQITLNNLQFSAFVLLHELGHRTGTLRPDGNDPFGFLSILNSGDVQKACFPEAIPVAVP